MKKLLVLGALIVLAVPAAYAAAPSKEKPAKSEAQSQSSGSSAANACKAELASLGAAAFAKKYGTNHNLKNAFGKCVSGRSKGKDEAKGTNQGKEDEQQGQNEAEDDDQVQQGDQGEDGKSQAKHDEHGQQSDQGEANDQGTSDAAKQCKKELASMGGAAFANRYGTNHNKHNAFGKCVSSKSKGRGESDND